VTAAEQVPLSFIGDPSVIVYAARWALGRRGSHAATLVADAISVNSDRLPHGARQVIIREVAAWLDGPGATAAREDRAPWVTALAAFGIRRSTVRTETPGEEPLPPTSTAARRRRTDAQQAAS
jgi:hypothetical protein